MVADVRITTALEGIQKVQQDLKGLQGDLGNVEKSVRPLGERLGSLGGSMRRVGLAASVAAIPLAAIGPASVRAFGDFQASMANISTLVDTSVESMEEMSSAVLSISREAPVALSDLTAALYDIRSAGIDSSDAISVLENSSRLAVSGLGSVKEATDLVTSSINAFNLTGEEQVVLYDNIFKTVQAGKTTISQLAQGFGAVAGTVANAGIKLDEYLASVAALTTTGLPAAQAHTQIRAAIAGLTRDSELASEVFTKLGSENFADLIQQSGGMVRAFERITEALGGNDANMIKLFGSIEAYNAVVGLTGSVNDTFTSTLDGMRSGINAVDEAFNKQNETFQATTQRLQNSMESIAISVGTVLVPTLQKLAEGLAVVADWFNNLSPATQKIVVTVGALTAAIGPVLIVLGSLVSAIGALLPIITSVGAAIAALSSGPLLLIAAAVGAVVVAWQNWDTIIDIVSNLVSTIDSLIGGALTATLETAKSVVQGFVDIWQQASDALVGNSTIPEMMDAIRAQFARLPDEAVEPTRKATEQIERAFAGMTAGVDVARQQVVFLGRVVPETLFDVAFHTETVARSMHQSFQQFFVAAIRSGESFSTLMKDLFSSIADAVIAEFARIAASQVFRILFGVGGGASRGTIGTASGGALAGTGAAGGGQGGLLGGAVGTGLLAGGAGFLGGQLLQQLDLPKAVSGIGGALLGAGLGFAIGGPIGALIGGLGGGFGGFFQTGGQRIVHQPTLIGVGETGPELVSVTPLGSRAAHGAGGGVAVVFNGPTIIDDISMLSFERRMARAVRTQQGRVV
jgi:TP901 family phage tail tape measure protein